MNKIMPKNGDYRKGDFHYRAEVTADDIRLNGIGIIAPIRSGYISACGRFGVSENVYRTHEKYKYFVTHLETGYLINRMDGDYSTIRKALCTAFKTLAEPEARQMIEAHKQTDEYRQYREVIKDCPIHIFENEAA